MFLASSLFVLYSAAAVSGPINDKNEEQHALDFSNVQAGFGYRSVNTKSARSGVSLSDVQTENGSEGRGEADGMGGNGGEIVTGDVVVTAGSSKNYTALYIAPGSIAGRSLYLLHNGELIESTDKDPNNIDDTLVSTEGVKPETFCGYLFNYKDDTNGDKTKDSRKACIDAFGTTTAETATLTAEIAKKVGEVLEGVPDSAKVPFATSRISFHAIGLSGSKLKQAVDDDEDLAEFKDYFVFHSDIKTPNECYIKCRDTQDCVWWESSSLGCTLKKAEFIQQISKFSKNGFGDDTKGAEKAGKLCNSDDATLCKTNPESCAFGLENSCIVLQQPVTLSSWKDIVVAGPRNVDKELLLAKYAKGETDENAKSDNTRLIAIICISVIVVLALLLGAFVFYKASRNRNSSSTFSNRIAENQRAGDYDRP